jgi:hypothetical protein
MPANPAMNLPLRTEPGKTDYLLYNDFPEGNNPILYLKIPDEYTGGNKEPVHNFGALFTVWYPGMSGSFNPANKGSKDCTGWCKGEISLLIHNWSGRDYTIFDRSAEVFHRNMAEQTTKTAIYTKIKNDEFDASYEIRRNDGDIRLIHMKKPRHKQPAYYISCHKSAPSPSCTVDININTPYYMHASYTYGMALFSQWKDVDAKVRSLITSFIVTSFDKY